MRRRLVLLLFSFLAVSIPPAVAGAQQIKKGELTGKVETAFSYSTEFGVPKLLLQVPPKLSFVLTQVCRSHDDNSLSIGDGAPGTVIIVLEPGAFCTTFAPGLAIEPGSALYHTLGLMGNGHLYVTGVLTK